MKASTTLSCSLCLAAGLTLVLAQESAAPLFDRAEVMIPARDGVRLHAVVFTPKNAAEPLPILLERTLWRGAR